MMYKAYIYVELNSNKILIMQPVKTFLLFMSPTNHQ